MILDAAYLHRVEIRRSKRDGRLVETQQLICSSHTDHFFKGVRKPLFITNPRETSTNGKHKMYSRVPSMCEICICSAPRHLVVVQQLGFNISRYDWKHGVHRPEIALEQVARRNFVRQLERVSGIWKYYRLLIKIEVGVDGESRCNQRQEVMSLEPLLETR